MIRFDSRARIILSDSLPEDVWTLVKEEGASDVALIADANIAEGEEFRALKRFLESQLRLRCQIIRVTEPTTEMVNSYTAGFREKPPELLIGMGGGSTLDLTKAISVMAVNDGLVEEYHGTGRPFVRGIRKILIPTTAGTGSEVTMGAVLVNEKTSFKRSIAGRFVTADYAVLNAKATVSMPVAVTAYTGMDALGHAVESFTAKCANEVTRMYSLKAFSLVYNNLPKVLSDPHNLQYRRNILLGSCLAGYAIYNSNTGACHSISYPLGIFNRVPHGLAVAVLLPEVVAINVEKGCELYAELYNHIAGVALPLSPGARAEGFAANLAAYEPLRHLGKTLRDFGISEANVDFLAERGLDLKPALANNPVEFTFEDARRVLRQAL